MTSTTTPAVPNLLDQPRLTSAQKRRLALGVAGVLLAAVFVAFGPAMWLFGGWTAIFASLARRARPGAKVTNMVLAYVGITVGTVGMIFVAGHGAGLW